VKKIFAVILTISMMMVLIPAFGLLDAEIEDPLYNISDELLGETVEEPLLDDESDELIDDEVSSEPPNEPKDEPMNEIPEDVEDEALDEATDEPSEEVEDEPSDETEDEVSDNMEDDSLLEYEDDEYLYAVAMGETLFDLSYGQIRIELGTEPDTIKVVQDGVIIEVDIPKETQITITGSYIGNEDGIYVANGVIISIKLYNVDITIEPDWPDDWFSIVRRNAFNINGGNVTLELSGENRLDSGWYGMSNVEWYGAGLRVPAGSSLTINGTGSLEARGGTDSAGIGGNIFENSGNITINSGTIYAFGNCCGAGIGGGWHGDGGTVVINGGVVFAQGGLRGGAPGSGIGSGGRGWEGGTLTLGGNGVVIANSANTAITGTQGILFVGNTGTMFGDVTLERDMTIPSGRTLILDSGTLTVPGGVTLTNDGTIFIMGDASIVQNGNIVGAGEIINLADGDEDIFPLFLGAIRIEEGTNANTIRVLQGGVLIRDNIPQETQITITGSYFGFDHGIYVAPDLTVSIRLAGVDIEINGYQNAFNIDGANVTLELSGENRLSSWQWTAAGLRVPTGSSLTIGGTGSLEVGGGSEAAGIGGNRNEAFGSLTINSGTITAHGSWWSGIVGIGSGWGAAGGSVVINGGVVTAHGGIGGIETFILDGNAIVFTNVVHAETVNNINGILFESGRGEMFGDVTIEQDMIIPGNAVLRLDSGTLTIAPGVMLTNNGAILIRDDAEILHGGTFGTLLGNVPLRNITISEILGVYAPVPGEIPATTITENAQFTGTVEWSPNHSVFQAGVRYTMEITLTPREGYTFIGVPESFFTIAGIANARNTQGSGIITAVFSATDTDNHIFDISDGAIRIEEGTTAGTIRVAYGDGRFMDNIPQNTQITITGSYASNAAIDGIYVAADVTANIRLSYANINVTASNRNALNINGANVTLYLSGTNILRSGGGSGGWNPAGLRVPTNSTVIINGSGSLEARGGSDGAGIGGNHNESAGIITINNGRINAIGGSDSAGIGGGRFGSGGTVTINGGVVTASGSARSMAIGRGGGSGSNLPGGGTLTITGNAVVLTTNTNATVTSTQGILFIGENGEMFGDVTLEQDVAISIGRTLILDSGTLTIAPGATLTNNGTILLEGDAEVLHGGAFGTLAGNIPVRNITISEILGVNPPIPGEIPVTTITENAQFTGTVEWSPNHSVFQAGIRYTATITLTPRAGYTFIGVPANFFTVTGAAIVTNNANSGVVTAVFSATDTDNHIFDITDGSIRIENGTNADTVKVTRSDGQVLDNIPENTQITITGNYSSNVAVDAIYVASGVTTNIRLNNVNITVNSDPSRNAFNINGGNVTLELVGTNTLINNGWFNAGGVRVPAGSSLTINGTGSLEVRSGPDAAGIGGNHSEPGGTITINSGTISVFGGSWGSAIGGGRNSSGGTVTINGGVVTATGGNNGIGIGRGANGGDGGTLTITGNAVVFANSTNADITRTQGILFIGNNGEMFGDVTIEQNVTFASDRILLLRSGTLTIAPNITLTNNGLILVDASAIVNHGGDPYGYIVGTGEIRHSQTNIDNNVFDISFGPIRIEEGTTAGTIRVAHGNGQVSDNIPQGTQITITGNYSSGVAIDGIYVASGVTANVRLDNVNITVTASNRNAFNINGGNVTLELYGMNVLVSGSNAAGIRAPAGSSLAIGGNGSLTANGVSDGAGIGGNHSESAGTITINSGGWISAFGGSSGAGIGGGWQGGGGTVTINGGVVTATGGWNAIGIGRGWGNADGGTLTLNGNAVVFASSTNADITRTQGILFIGNDGEMFGDVTIEQSMTIASNQTLVLGSRTLTIAPDVTLTNNGMILHRDGSSILHGGAFGTLTGWGSVRNLITISEILGVTPPIAGETAATTIIANEQFTGTVQWSPNHSVFQDGVRYTATITLTTLDDFVFRRVPSNFFTVAGAATVTNNANMGVITAVFPITDVGDNFFDITGGPIRIEHGTNANTVRVIHSGGEISDNIPRDEQIIIIGSYSSNVAVDGIQVASEVTANVRLHYVNINASASSRRAFLISNDATVNLELSGTNTLRSGANAAGLQVVTGSSLTIFGDGSLSAFGGSSESGIGSRSVASGSITINSGTITATGAGSGATGGQGIGGNNANVTINGGNITAVNGGNGVGIGGTGTNASVTINGGTISARGWNSPGIGSNQILITGGNITANASGTNGINGETTVTGGIVTTNFINGTLTVDGNAVVFATTVNATTAATQGILFIGNIGTVHGDVTLEQDVTIPTSISRTLTVPSGASLIMPAGITLTNDVTIIPADGSTVTVNGTVLGNKINGANVAPPTLSSRTYNSIMLNVAELLAATGQSMEFAINTINSVPTGGWQESTEFTGLASNTTYYFFARSVEDDNFRTGAASIGSPITTSAGNIEITDIIFNDDGTEITVEFDSQTRATIIIAFRDESGRFLGAVNKYITSQNSEISNISIPQNTYKISFKIWDGLSNMNPLDDVEIAVRNDVGDWVLTD